MYFHCKCHMKMFKSCNFRVHWKKFNPFNRTFTTQFLCVSCVLELNNKSKILLLTWSKNTSLFESKPQPGAYMQYLRPNQQRPLACFFHPDNLDKLGLKYNMIAYLAWERELEGSMPTMEKSKANVPGRRRGETPILLWAALLDTQNQMSKRQVYIRAH